jgi:hypothetical protein
MSIVCHSSFDTNLRIRVSTPTGQKDLQQTKSSAGKSDRRQQAASPTSVPRTADNGTIPAAAVFIDHSSYGAAFDPQFSNTQTPATPSICDSVPGFESFQLPEAWPGCFGIPPVANPSLQSTFCTGVGTGSQATEPSMYSPTCFDSATAWMPSYCQQISPVFSPEITADGGQNQEEMGGGQWFPPRC